MANTAAGRLGPRLDTLQPSKLKLDGIAYIIINPFAYSDACATLASQVRKLSSD